MRRWPTARLGDHTSLISSGATPLGGSQVYLSKGPVLFVRSQNILMNRLSLDEAVFLSTEMDAKLARTRLKSGDVLLNITGASIGRVATFTGYAGPANVNQHVCVIRPTEDLDATFLSWFISSPYVQASIDRMQSGGTRQALTFAKIADFEIPLPPLDEQRRIAAILDQADALRAKRRVAFDIARSLAPSLYYSFFGDPVTNPRRLPVGTLTDVVTDPKRDIRCGPFGTQLKVAELTDSGVPLLGIENVVNNRFESRTRKYLTEEKANELRAFDVRPGDVLVTRMGTIGRASVVPATLESEARFSYHLFRVRPDPSRCLAQFMSSTITSSGTFLSQLKKLAHGQIMEGLSVADLKAVKFFIPSLENQMRFVECLSRMEGNQGEMGVAADALDSLFASLQHRAFRGEL